MMSTTVADPGPVESGSRAEIAGLDEDRPGLAQVALALARIMDNPRLRADESPGCGYWDSGVPRARPIYRVWVCGC
jgi:hypothetical protein